MATATALKPSGPKKLPPPNSDFYQFAETLGADELAILKRVRAFMETKVAPIIDKYWAEDAFPFEVLEYLIHDGANSWLLASCANRRCL